jgi:phage terminase large subunit GpA-like protein
VIPAGCKLLTIGVDVGKWRLHWVVRAWLPDGSAHTIDYGTHAVYDQIYGSDEGLGRAVRSAVLSLVSTLRGAVYCDPDGEVATEMIREAMIVVDAGYRTDDVYAACASAGLGVYPIMGFGDGSNGATRIRYNATKDADTEYLGDHCKIKRRRKESITVRLVECCGLYWKAWEHDRWMTAMDRPGHFLLFGERPDDPTRLSADQRSHGTYAEQICNEVEIEEPYKGGIRRKWKQKGDNHYLDASYYADVAGSIQGIALPGPEIRKIRGKVPTAVVEQRPPASQRPSARDLAAKARGR